MSASSTVPESKLLGRRKSKRIHRLSPWLLLPIALMLITMGLLIWQLRQAGASSATTSTTTVTRGILALSVTGSGTVEAAQSRSLSFRVSGTVDTVLVQQGDVVKSGQPLARLDTRELNLAVQEAEANLKSAEAQLADVQGNGATDLELANARAGLASAEASYANTRNGSATPEDIASARAQLHSAQLSLAELKAGPTSTEISSARTTLEKAQLTLASQRESLAAAKVTAESAMTTAANSLRDAQDSYSTIYWDNREQEKLPGDLSQSAKDEESAALRAVHTAEENFKQAQLSYQQAKQDEITGVAQAGADLKDAQVQLDDLLAGSTDAELASAQASVASAQANLDSLLHPASAADLASSQASVDQARIALEQLTSPASNSDMASAEASLAQAQVALASAKLDLQRAVLSAPFDGVVATVDLAPGDTEADGTIEVIDASQMYIEISLSESDVSKVQPDMPVTLTFDAIADLEVIGNVDTVAPMATVTSNVATYPVRVSFNPGDAPIKVGMTATGTIVTQQIDDAIIVPTRAIQSMGDMQMLEVRVAPDQPTVPLRVETGLSADGQTEILSCVDTGSQCLKEGDTLVIRTTTTTSSTTQRRGGLGGFGGGGLRGGRPFP